MVDVVYADRVLLEIIDPPEEGGYIIPQGQEEKSLVGKVVYIGEKVLDTKVGDIVVFEELESKEISLEGDTLTLTREESLICKLKSNE